MVAVVSTTLGSKIYISDGSVTNATDTQAEYEALTWIEIAGVAEIPEFGDASESVNYDVIGEGRRRKQKGIRDAGDVALRMAFDSSDTGQQEIILAEASSLNWAFKVELDDAITVSGTNTTFYFRGKVMGKRGRLGTASNVVERLSTIAIDSDVIEVVAT